MVHFGPLPVLTSAHMPSGTVAMVPAEVAEELASIQARVGALTKICEREEVLDLAAAERRHIERVLELAGGNRSQAARWLGIARSTLKRKGF